MGECINIICFKISWVNYCWVEISWLLISWLGEGNSKVGNMIIKVIIGSFISVGVVKEENKFLFILFFMGKGMK